MVKQIGVQNIPSIKGQSYKLEPASLEILSNTKHHETKASILKRLQGGRSKDLTKLETMKKHGLSGGGLGLSSKTGTALTSHPSHQQNRYLEDVMASRAHRKVIPFKGDENTSFLKFKSGRSTMGAKLTRGTAQGRKMIKIDTAFNRL